MPMTDDQMPPVMYDSGGTREPVRRPHYLSRTPDIDAIADKLRTAFMVAHRVAYLLWGDSMVTEDEREAWRAVARAAVAP